MTEHAWVRYIGIPYTKDYDCQDFVEEFVRNEFYADFALPRDDTLRNYEVTSDTLDKYSTGFTKTDAPKDGDVVLLRIAGYLHVGVYLTHRGVPHVLHNTEGAGVIMQRLRELEKRIQAFYQWNNFRSSIQPSR